LKGISNFFLLISHFDIRLWISHMKNSVFQLNHMYLSTVNQQIRAVRHVTRPSSSVQGRRHQGGQWCTAPAIENCDPPFHLWPSGCCIHLIQFFWNVAPRSHFWPLFLVFGPPCC